MEIVLQKNESSAYFHCFQKLKQMFPKMPHSTMARKAKELSCYGMVHVKK